MRQPVQLPAVGVFEHDLWAFYLKRQHRRRHPSLATSTAQTHLGCTYATPAGMPHLSVRGLQRTKTDLAVKDEMKVKELAKDRTVAIAFDNMDKKANKTLQHYTLPRSSSRNRK